MHWISFFTGVMSATFALAIFSQKEEFEEEQNEVELNEENITINGFKQRHVKLSCQTCRKLKIHKEIEPNLYQCVKCKRHVDLRAS
jgi:acetyl-CoA carboxylase beta subunit